MSHGFSLTKKHSAMLVILILIIPILAVYWQVQFYELINYDDHGYVISNYLIQSGITFQSVTDTFVNIHTGHWHPLSMLSHMLDWQVFGDKAGGHHWTNVIIHILNTILLFLFLKSITGAIWRSAFVVALFALHPINVESVAWIAERKNVLSTFFWILTMISYVWYVKSPGWKRYLPVFFCFALGLMSKVMLVTLPFVLLLLDYWPLKRTRIYQQNKDQTTNEAFAVKKEKISFLILEKIPLFILSAISILLALHAAGSVNTVGSLESFPIRNRLANAIVSYGLYIKKMFWPIDLAVFYPFNYHLPLLHIILAVSLIFIITIFVCVYFRRFPYLPIGWFWYLGTLIPVIGIIQVGGQAMADRYAYVPFIGLFIMLTWATNDIFKKKVSVKIIAIVSILAIAVLSIIAYFQASYWKNTFTLFTHTLNVTKNNAVAHSILAGEYLKQNKIKEAMIQCQAALALDPKNYNTFVRAAWAYSVQGEKKKAIETLYRAVEIDPRNVRAYNDLYIMFLRMGKKKEALHEYEKAVEINNDNPEFYQKLGNALAMQGYYEEAIKQYYEVLRIRPRDARAHNNLGMVLMRQGSLDEAAKHFRKAIGLQPEYANAHFHLAKILRQKGVIEEANYHYQAAIRVNPEFKNIK